MKNKPSTGDREGKNGQRRQRQATALRDNLKKRKQQIRDRGDGKNDGKETGESPG